MGMFDLLSRVPKVQGTVLRYVFVILFIILVDNYDNVELKFTFKLIYTDGVKVNCNFLFSFPLDILLAHLHLTFLSEPERR